MSCQKPLTETQAGEFGQGLVDRVPSDIRKVSQMACRRDRSFHAERVRVVSAQVKIPIAF